MTDIVLLYVTVPDKAAADRLADALLNEGLAACTNLLPEMESRYHWRGKIEISRESVLIVKTTGDFAGRCRARIESLHPYEVPCILSLPVADGNAAYLNWLKGSLG